MICGNNYVTTTYCLNPTVPTVPSGSRQCVSKHTESLHSLKPSHFRSYLFYTDDTVATSYPKLWIWTQQQRVAFLHKEKVNADKRFIVESDHDYPNVPGWICETRGKHSIVNTAISLDIWSILFSDDLMNYIRPSQVRDHEDLAQW
jgi:hypothetical protein